MWRLLFWVGSLITVICSVMLLLAVVMFALVGRPASALETGVAFTVSGIAGVAWLYLRDCGLVNGSSNDSDSGHERTDSGLLEEETSTWIVTSFRPRQSIR